MTFTTTKPSDKARVPSTLVDLLAGQMSINDRLSKLQATLDTLLISRQTPSYSSDSPATSIPSPTRTMNQQTQGTPYKTLVVRVYDMLFPITIEVIQTIFSPFGLLSKVEIVKSPKFQALVTFECPQKAAAARHMLQGRNIYDYCCQLDIQFEDPNIDIVAADLEANKLEVKTQEQDVQVLLLQSIQNEVLDEAFAENQHTKIEFGCVSVVNSDLVDNVQPIDLKKVAAVQKFGSSIAAHQVFDTMPEKEFSDFFEAQDLIPKSLQIEASNDTTEIENDPQFQVATAMVKESAAALVIKYPSFLLDPGGVIIQENRENMLEHNALDSGYRLFHTVHVYVNEITLNLLANEDPLALENDAFVLVHKDYEKLASYSGAHILFDKMPPLDLALFNLAEEKARQWMNCKQISTKNCVHDDGIETELSATIVKKLLLLFDPGGKLFNSIVAPQTRSVSKSNFSLSTAFNQGGNVEGFSGVVIHGTMIKLMVREEHFMGNKKINSCAARWSLFLTTEHMFAQKMFSSNFQEKHDLLGCFNGISDFGFGGRKILNECTLPFWLFGVQKMQSTLILAFPSPYVYDPGRDMAESNAGNIAKSSDYVMDCFNNQAFAMYKIPVTTCEYLTDCTNRVSIFSFDGNINHKLEMDIQMEPINISSMIALSAPNILGSLRTILYELEIYFIRLIFVFDPGGLTICDLSSILEDKDHFEEKGMS